LTPRLSMDPALHRRVDSDVSSNAIRVVSVIGSDVRGHPDQTTQHSIVGGAE